MANVTLGGGPPLPAGKISQGYVEFLSIAAVFTTLSTVCVALRFASRRLTASTGQDDWTSLGSLIFAYGFLITRIIMATTAYAGYHFASFTTEQFEEYLKIHLASYIIYNCSITLSKISLLLFYRRIFAIRSFKVIVWIFVAIVTAFWAVSVFGLIFAYAPVEAQWKFWLPHHSIDNEAFWLAAGIINIVLDVGILCLPQVRVWHLQLTTRRKILLSLVFLMGFFTCITSIVRIVYLENVDWKDPTYTITNAVIWSLIEINMSIICGCAPTFPNLFRHWFDGDKHGFSKFNTANLMPGWLSRLRENKENDSNNQQSEGKHMTSSSAREELTPSPCSEVAESICVRTDVRVQYVQHDLNNKNPNLHHGW